MPDFKHIAIIYNPKSTGPSKLGAKWLERGLKKRLPDIQVELLRTEHAGHAEELAHDFAKNYPGSLIVSSSGDGGYHEVINGIVSARQSGAHAFAAVLPAGNANDHRQAVKQQPLLSAITSGKSTSIDLLKVSFNDGNDKKVRYAHSYVGFGLTPQVAKELNRQNLNRFREALIVTRTLSKLQPFKAEVDGTTQDFDSIVCTNIPKMAKYLRIANNASHQDGKFEVIIFAAGPKPGLLLSLLKAITTGVANARSENRFKVTVLQPMPLQLDGEVYELKAGTIVSITAAPQTLQAIV